jgi:riboflavin synthase
MFTGIIKEMARLHEISRLGSIKRFAVESEHIFKNVNVGDSVSVNGACLTVTEKEGNLLYFDVIGETLEKTTLGNLKPKGPVNLEDSLKVGDPLSGHLVLGHIDCVGKIKNIEKIGENVSMELEIPKEFSDLIAQKGSIAIDGVSLTVGGVKANVFKVHLIPHTLKVTTLKYRKRGDEVNVEFDVIARYIMKSKEGVRASGIDEKFLREKGFI